MAAGLKGPGEEDDTYVGGGNLPLGPVPDPTFDQQSPKKVRWMAAGLKEPGEEDATYVGGGNLPLGDYQEE